MRDSYSCGDFLEQLNFVRGDVSGCEEGSPDILRKDFQHGAKSADGTRRPPDRDDLFHTLMFPLNAHANMGIRPYVAIEQCLEFIGIQMLLA
jgi:hypothetical protein